MYRLTYLFISYSCRIGLSFKACKLYGVHVHVFLPFSLRGTTFVASCGTECLLNGIYCKKGSIFFSLQIVFILRKVEMEMAVLERHPIETYPFPITDCIDLCKLV